MKNYLLFLFVFASLQAHSSDLQVGFSKLDFTPKVGVPLAGYGSGERRAKIPDIFNKHPYAFFLNPSKGVLDPLFSRTMVLKKEGQKTLVMMSLDLVGITDGLRKDLLKELQKFGVDESHLIVTATHTHSGPGTLARALMWELLATDLYHPGIYREFIQKVVQGAKEALKNGEEAELLQTKLQVKDLQTNRRNKTGHFDPESIVVLARSKKSSDYLGGFMHLAIHGTALPPSNFYFSGDVPGAMAKALEEELKEKNKSNLSPTILFFNGAEGDVTPSEDGVEGMKNLASKFQDQARLALENLSPMEETWVMKTGIVKLIDATPNLPGCLEHAGNQPEDPKHIDHGFSQKGDISQIGNKPVKLWAGKLGDLVFFSWPGEPTTSLGFVSKNIGLQAGAKNSFALGLTNDHLAYFTTPEEFREGGYEACMSFFGPIAGEQILEVQKKLAKELFAK